jgi:hypothetical protein
MTLRSLIVSAAVVLVPAVAAAQDTTVIIPPQQQPAPPPATTTVIEPVATPVGPADNGTVVVDPLNTGAFATGAVVFGGTYLASIIVAGESNTYGDQRLYVPLVGPWLDLYDRSNCPISETRCDNATSAKVLLIADGVFQAAGVLGMLDGVLDPTHHRSVIMTSKRDVHIIPTVNGDGGGLAAIGRF